KDGTLLYWIGINLDIEERKQAETKLQEQDVEFRQILDLTPQHVGVLGPEGKPLYANRAALGYFGVDIDEWKTEGARLNYVHPDDREQFLCERQQRFLGGPPQSFEARVLGHDGKFRWHLFRLNPLKDDH